MHTIQAHTLYRHPAVVAFGIFFSGIVSGFLVQTAFAWWYVFVALVPLLVCIVGGLCRHKIHAFILGLLYGFGYVGVMYVWMLYAGDLPWFSSVSSDVAFIFAGLTFSITVGIIALGYGLWSVCLYITWSRWTHAWWYLPSAAGVFVVLELFVASLLHAVWYGNGAVLIPHHTLSMHGYALAGSVWSAQLAWFGGVWLLSGIVALSALAITRFFQRPCRQRALTVVFIICVMPVVAYGVRASADAWHARGVDESEYSVVVLQSMRPVGVEDVQPHYMELAERVIAELADTEESFSLVIAPEGINVRRSAQTYPNNEPIQKMVDILERMRKEGTMVIDSRMVEQGGRLRWRVEGVRDDMTYSSEKTYLLPQGEYTPRLQAFMQSFAPTSSEESLRSFQKKRAFVTGESKRMTFDNTPESLAVLFCSEVMSPFLYAQHADAGARIFVNIASHAWFPNHSLLQQRTFSLARARAVESGRPYIQSGNYTGSFVLDRWGRTMWYHDTAVGAHRVHFTAQDMPMPSPYTLILGFVLRLL